MELNIPGVYKITNSLNQKFYIGSAVDIRKRWNLHLMFLRRGKHHSRHLQRAFIKYGECVFTIEVLEQTERKRAALLECEQFYLDTLQPFRSAGYNICRKAGSALGVKRTADAREKNRLRMLGNIPWNKGKKRPPFSEEWKRKLGAKSGKDNHFFGKKHTDATKKIIGAKNKGKSVGERNFFYGKDFSGPKNGMFGKTHSEATRKLLGANKGRVFPEETRQRMSAAQKGKPAKRAVIQKDLTGNTVARFSSIADAARAVNTSVPNIQCCVYGRSRTAKGFRWELAA